MINQIWDTWNTTSLYMKLAIAVLVVLVMAYVYNNYIVQQSPYMMINEGGHGHGGHVDQVDHFTKPQGASDEITCTMYYVDWCPHCQKAKPEWGKFEEKYNGQTINGKKVLVVKINCEENPDVAEKEQLSGYPSFKFNLNGKNYDFEDARVYDRFEAFLQHVTSA